MKPINPQYDGGKKKELVPPYATGTFSPSHTLIVCVGYCCTTWLGQSAVLLQAPFDNGNLGHGLELYRCMEAVGNHSSPSHHAAQKERKTHSV